jgi:hypothetical protein
VKWGAWTALVLFLFAGGCATIPFEQPKLVSLESRDPQTVVKQFRESEPDKYQLLSTVVFEYNSRRFSAISSLRINRGEREFAVAGMNPMGVKLFEFSGKREQVTTLYVLPAFSRYGDLGSAMGSDIRRIYFDLAPASGATLWRKRCKLVYRQSSGPGFLEYVFGGEDGDLIEKNYYENNMIVWRVSYYEYRDTEGFRWPQGVVFINYDYGYRLTVRHKEFRVEHN